MTDWSGSLARAFDTYLKIAGSSGSSGSVGAKVRWRRDLSASAPGTSVDDTAVPPVPSGSTRFLGTGGTKTNVAAVPEPNNAKSLGTLGFRGAGTAGTAYLTSARDLASERIGFHAGAGSRTASVEPGADVPQAWVEGFAQLDEANWPVGFTRPQWEQVMKDGRRFLDRGWGARAAALGWSVTDVFGVHRLLPYVRYDAMGLVPLIRGGDVVDIRSDRAIIRSELGNCLTYYLTRKSTEAVALWESTWPGSG